MSVHGTVYILLGLAAACVGQGIFYQNMEFDSRQQFEALMRQGSVSYCVKVAETVTCPHPQINFYLYTDENIDRVQIDTTDPNWFASSTFDATKSTVLLIHGFDGGDQNGTFPLLRRAYVKTGLYNVISVDFWQIVRPPCLIDAVYSVQAIGKCVAHLLNFLESSASVDYQQVPCVGYGFGAHVCGVTANYLTSRLQKIIGVDPGRPLMQFRSRRERLDTDDADQVQVIHTNAGFWGVTGYQGSVDFCVDGGLIQTSCYRSIDPNGCSHLQALCIMAESLFAGKERSAIPCDKYCPYIRIRTRSGENATLGQSLSSTAASGMYCLSVPTAPYCLTSADPTYGDSLCCTT